MTSPPFTITVTAEIVAWYGAVVSTAALAATAFTLWRDRSRIVVEGAVGMRVTRSGPYDPTKDYIVITVRNRGRRPRTIDKVGLVYRLPEKSQPVMALGDMAHKGPRNSPRENRRCGSSNRTTSRRQTSKRTGRWIKPGDATRDTRSDDKRDPLSSVGASAVVQLQG